MSQLKKALITGISGQDGSYLAELLLSKGYEVHGLVRRSSSFNTRRLDPIYRDPHEANYAAGACTTAISPTRVAQPNLIRDVQPQEIYHLGAQSHVRVSFDIPEYTARSPGSARCASSRRSAPQACRPRFYQASSSEMFGARRRRRTEARRFIRARPTPPPSCTRTGSRSISVRRTDMYAVNGMLFNHE